MQTSRLDELQPLKHIRTRLLPEGASTLWAEMDGEGHSGFVLLCEFGRVAFLQDEVGVEDGKVDRVAAAGDFAAGDAVTECLDRGRGMILAKL